MISEALELRVLGGRVSHSWCMGAVCHGYGGWVGAEMDVVDGIHAGKMGLFACQKMPEHFSSTR